MTRIAVGDVSLGYQIDGTDGDWVLMIMGLGYGRWGWAWQVPALAKRFRVITFDNRGIGESDAPEGPFTAQMLAKDAVGLLDALGIDRAHVVGTSLGGYVAQELAIGYPERVARLALACTGFGGPRMLPMPERTVRLMQEAPVLPDDLRLRRFIENAFTEPFVAERQDVIERLMAFRRETAQPLAAWSAQAAAGSAFDAADRVARITAETLVITGTDDAVVAPGNARLLAAEIPGARLAEMPGGHLFFVEHAEEFNELLISFLCGEHR